MAIVKIVNAQDGSDARYDVNQMTPEERQGFAPDGKPLGADNPDQWTWTDGLPGAREGNAEHGGAAGPGGGSAGMGGGYGDAYINQIRSALQAASASDLSGSRSAIQKMLIGYGLMPEGFEDKLGSLDDVTKSLIAKNTESGISRYARLMQQKKDSVKSLVGRLNSTGMLRSGSRGKKLRQGQLDFDRLFQDDLAELLGQVGQVQSGYANNEQARQMQLLQAMQNSQNMFSGQGGSRMAAPSPTGSRYSSTGASMWAPIQPGEERTLQVNPSLKNLFSPPPARGGTGGRQKVM